VFYRLGGAPQRLSRGEDEVFVDAAGMATAWLPCAAGDVANVYCCKAYLNSPSNPSANPNYIIQKTNSWIASKFLLEAKRGAEPDIAAWPLMDWTDQLVNEMVVIPAPNWIRLRLITYTPPFLASGDGGPTTVSVGLAFRLYTQRATVTNLKVSQ